MRKRKIDRKIIYISLSVLVILGTFFGVTKTASANNDRTVTFIIDGNNAYPVGPVNIDDVGSDNKEKEDGKENEDSDEPRMCTICREKECMEGKDYCYECHLNLESAKIYVETMMEREKRKEEAKAKESAQKEIDEQVEEWSKKQGPSKKDIAMMPLVFGSIGIFIMGIIRYFFKVMNSESGENMYVNTNENSYFETFDEEIPKAESVVDTVMTPEDFEDLEKSKKTSETEMVNESGKLTKSEIISESEKNNESKKTADIEKVKETEKKNLKQSETEKATETEILPGLEYEKVIGKKEFLECLKQQTTFYHSPEPFVVGTTDGGEFYILDYAPNNFVMVKAKLEDNGKLNVIYDYRKNYDTLVGIDYELGKNSLRFRIKSSKGIEADFVLKPVVKENIKRFKIECDQSKDYGKIVNEYLPGYIIWIQNNADFIDGMKKELSNQELKEKVKSLDPAEKNKFVELAKNGKTEEAIKVCNEVTGLGLKEAKRIIEYKLYY